MSRGTKMRKKRKLPLWVAKMILVFGCFFVLLIILGPFIVLLLFGEDVLIRIGEHMIAIGMIGGTTCMITLFALDGIVGFKEPKSVPLRYQISQNEYKEFIPNIQQALLERGYKRMGRDRSKVIRCSVLYIKRGKGSYDYAFSILEADSFSDENSETKTEQFFDEIDETIEHLFEESAEQGWIRKHIGLVILVVLEKTSVDLQVFLGGGVVQDLDRSIVAAALVKNDGEIYIANEKDTMAIKRYRAIQREAKAILILDWTGTEKH